MKKMVLLCLAVIFSPNSICYAEIYIDNNLLNDCHSGNYSVANRNCSGTDGNAYKKIQEAEGNALSGDTIYFRSGTYRTSRVTWDQAYDALVTVKAYNNENVKIKPLDEKYLDNTFPIFVLNGSANIKFENLEFDGEQDKNCTGFCEDHGNHNYHFAIGSSSGTGNANWSANNLNVHDFAHAGLKGGNWDTIENSVIHKIGKKRYDHAVYLWGDGTTIQFNYFHSIQGYGVHAYSLANNFKILYNIIRDYGKDTNNPQDGAGILIAGNNPVIIGNICDTGDRGITVWTNTDGFKVKNNIFMRNRISDIVVENSNTHGSNSVFENNIYASSKICIGCSNNAISFDDIPPNISDTPRFAVKSPANWKDYSPGPNGSQVNTGVNVGVNLNNALDPGYDYWPPPKINQDNHGLWEIGAFVYPPSKEKLATPLNLRIIN